MSFNILIVPDKFKGSLTSLAVCRIIREGLLASWPELSVRSLPLADGGDGLLEMIVQYRPVLSRVEQVEGPLPGSSVAAKWLLSADGSAAYIEMAAASGLALLDRSEYDCMKAATYGTGQLIRAAVEAGVKEIVIGIGGSATNDGGIGMAMALGVRFLDQEGKALSPAGGNLGRIARIDDSGKPDLSGIRFRVACDVRNPLCGPEGATRVYAPQKGATPEIVELLEAGMVHYAALLQDYTGRDVAGQEGSGAAGGLGAGCLAFLQAELVSGADLAIEYSGAEKYFPDADWIITAEGRLDGQTLQGKLVSGIASLGRKYNKPVLVFAGHVDLAPAVLREAGIIAAFSIADKPMSLEASIRDGESLLYNLSCNIGALLKRGSAR